MSSDDTSSCWFDAPLVDASSCQSAARICRLFAARGRGMSGKFRVCFAARLSTGPASNPSGHGNDNNGVVMLNGVSKATTSIRVVNQTLLDAASKVARAKLGFADRKHSAVAHVLPDVFEAASFADMLQNGMVRKIRVTNAEVEKLFAGTEGAGVDDYALAHPGEAYVELYIAYVNAPTIGRALLGDAQYKSVMARNFNQRHLWWVGTAGRDSIVNDSFLPGAQSPRLAMSQLGTFFELRDQDFEPKVVDAPAGLNASRLFGVNATASVDPASPLDLSLTITRAKGAIMPTLTVKQVAVTYAPPKKLFAYPPQPLPEWLLAWQARWVDLAVLSLSFAVLGVALARPRWISADAGRLRRFRRGFLAFTLFYIGWYAQGQLSIVQITGAVKTLKDGLSFASYLYDPISLLLIAFTLVTFIIWGRGAFCGWLCPFGALQEFVGLLARRLGLAQLRIPLALAKRMEWGRYLALAFLVGAAFLFPEQGVKFNEVEPFKTVTTFVFDRTWPYVAYALALLAAAFYHKAFCRFLCPLGAAMSLCGRPRRFDWLTRRAECGQPCQRCATACQYDAIEPSGEIRYDACFQCLDCIGIYHDSKRCVPIMLYEKKGKNLVPKTSPKTSSCEFHN